MMGSPMDYNLFKGLVTHIIDPSNFWMRIGTDYDMKMFNEYQQRLNDFYNADMWKYRCSINQLHPGYLVVVAKLPRDDEGFYWERAQVTRVDVDSQKADVFLVDMGYTAIVEVDMCRAITPELFNFLSPQASRVSLAGIKPLANSWTSRATNLLQNETAKQEVITLLVHYDEDSCCYAVVIYTKQNDGTWLSLIHEMQHRELAVGTGGVVAEVLTAEMVNECLQKMEESHKPTHLEDDRLETNIEDKNETTLVADDEIEQWDDKIVKGSEVTDYFHSNKSLENSNANDEHLQDSSLKEKPVIGCDYRTLMQTRSISISQMTREKGWETQEQAKTNIEKDLQRLDSYASHHDDQDWDAVQDSDYHVDIVSQIYYGVPDRQYSDDDIGDLLDGKQMLLMGPKKPTEVGKDDKNQNHHFEVIKKETGNSVDHIDINDFDSASGLTEIQSYKLEKAIKDILENKEEKESDVVCALIFSVVEPGVDAPADHLRVVICAILEYIIQNSCQHSEIAFAILDTYSDASEFGKALIEVIKELENSFVKKHQDTQLHNRHKEFAKVIAFVFKQTEDWDPNVCNVVQNYILTLAEKWIIFNKQRRLTEEEIISREMIFLKTANSFFTECYSCLNSKYEANLRQFMSEIRCKLLHDDTESSIRTFLLDMLLTFSGNCGQLTMQRVTTASASTQTEPFEGDAICTSTSTVDEKHDVTKTLNVVPEDKSLDLQFPELSSTYSSLNSDSLDAQSTDILSSLHKQKKIPKSIRNLPPRLFKKYLLEHAIMDTLPLSESDVVSRNDHLISQINSESFGTICEPLPCPSPTNEFASSQVTADSNMSIVEKEYYVLKEQVVPKISNAGDYFNESFKPSEQVENVEPKSCMKEISPPELPIQVSNQNNELSQNKNKLHIDNEGSKDDLECVTNISVSTFPVDYDGTNTTDVGVVSDKLSKENVVVVKEPDSVDLEKNVNEEYNQIVKNSVEIQKDTIIRYTPQQLFELNPFKNQPKLPLWDLWEPKEVLEKMIVMVNPGKSLEDESKHGSSKPLKSKLNPLAEDFKSRLSSVNVSALIDEKYHCGSSVDPVQVKPEIHDSDMCKDSKKNTSDVCMEGVDIYFKKENDNSVATDLCKSAYSATTAVSNDETWHDDFGGNNSGGFLKPKKNKDSGESRKAKKKKGRRKPLDEFLQEQSSLKTEAGEYIKEDFDDDEDFFSPEALQMYEKLEQQGIGKETEMEKNATVLMPSTIGSHVTNSSKRTSLFASIRSEQQSGQQASKPWCPGRKRFCTTCGSGDHVVYDCPERNPHLLQY